MVFGGQQQYQRVQSPYEYTSPIGGGAAWSPFSPQGHQQHYPSQYDLSAGRGAWRTSATSFGSRSYQHVPSGDDVELDPLKGPRHSSIALSTKDLNGRRFLFKGWRYGMFLGWMTAFLVFLFNLIIAIYAAVKGRSPDRKGNDGATVLFQGNCSKAADMNRIIHLVINVLSTLLLCASNFGMQCLSAPTLSDVEKAHREKRWLDIGVLSLRNLKSINKRRVVMWCLLGFSSLPLHFFYNSAVFSSIATQDYVVLSAYENMLSSTAASKSLGLNATEWPIAGQMYNQSVAATLTRLETKDCIAEYAVNFQTMRRNLLLVSQNGGAAVPPAPYLYRHWDEVRGVGFGDGSCIPDPYGWVCGHIHGFCGFQNQTCTAQIKNVTATSWSPMGVKVDYCLTEPLQQICKIQFSPHLAGVVITFNLIKALVLIVAWWTIKENPMMTIGDAIAEFLSSEEPDPFTRSFCWLDKAEIKTWKCTDPNVLRPRRLEPKVRRWSSVVSGCRWITLLVTYGSMIVLCFALFLWAIVVPIRSGNLQVSDLMSVEFGSADPRTMINWDVPTEGLHGFLANVMIANSPQVVLSAVYFTYNGLFTCFMQGREWNNYASRAKGLRVSGRREGEQRRSHRLQIPFKFAIPLVMLSMLLHWLCSQAIFLVSLQFNWDESAIRPGYYEFIGDHAPIELLTCGYTPRAILILVCIGITMMVFAILVGRTQFKNNMPLAGSCSAVISAACHPAPGENGAGAAMRKLKWGHIHTYRDDRFSYPVGHLAFSSNEVYPPQELWSYQ